MFNFFKKIINKINIRKQDEDNPEYRIKFAYKISDKKIKYVSERITDIQTNEIIDTIIGKNGYFNINKNNEISIYCNGTELFRAFLTDLKASEFLSLDGVILESFDLVTNRQRKIIVYYVYHRR